MEYPQDFLEIKKQLFDLVEISNKSIEIRTTRINQELACLQKGNNLIYLKVKDLIEKIEELSFRTNTTLVTEVSSQLTNNNTITPKHRRKVSHKSEEGKINIQNLVINKKVQIGKHFSKLNISNITTSPNKSINYQIDQHFNPQMRNIHNFHPKKNASIIKMRIFSKNKAKESYTHSETPLTGKIDNKTVNSDNSNTLNHEDIDKSNKVFSQNQGQKKANATKFDIVLKTSKSINDVRKFSIMDIPSIDMKELSLKNKKKNQKSMRNYLYSKSQKLHYFLAKQNVLPLKLRLIFAKKISNFYTKEDVYSDYYDYISSSYNYLISFKDEYQPFVPSLTSQVALNFITSIDEKKCMNMISNNDDYQNNDNNENPNNHNSNYNNNGNQVLTQNQLQSFYNLLIVFYYLVNEPIDDSLPKDAFNLYNDLLTRVLRKRNSASLKSHQLEAIHKTSMLSPYQLTHIQNIYDKIVNHCHFKPFDKVSSVMLFLLKDIYDYSLLKMSNGQSMIKYNFNLNRFKKLKAEFEQMDY